MCRDKALTPQCAGESSHPAAFSQAGRGFRAVAPGIASLRVGARGPRSGDIRSCRKGWFRSLLAMCAGQSGFSHTHVYGVCMSLMDGCKYALRFILIVGRSCVLHRADTPNLASLCPSGVMFMLLRRAFLTQPSLSVCIRLP
jgi:hypothetical protein